MPDDDCPTCAALGAELCPPCAWSVLSREAAGVDPYRASPLPRCA